MKQFHYFILAVWSFMSQGRTGHFYFHIMLSPQSRSDSLGIRKWIGGWTWSVIGLVSGHCVDSITCHQCCQYGTSGFLMAPKLVCFFKPWLSSYTSGFSMCFTRMVLEPCLASWRHQRACSGIFSDRESYRSMSINADGFSAATAFRGWDMEGEQVLPVVSPLPTLL